MESVARKIEVKAVFQQFGEALAVAGHTVTVRTPLADIPAKRAASCLLEPAVGDRVLLAVEDGGAAYVLAVLDREDGAQATISVEGDLVLRSLRGRVSVAAQEGVDIVSAATARATASRTLFSSSPPATISFPGKSAPSDQSNVLPDDGPSSSMASAG